MKFGALFESHKIPEWYDHYFDYKKFTEAIKTQKSSIKSNQLTKINGIHYLTEKNLIVQIPIFDHLPDFMQPEHFLSQSSFLSSDSLESEEKVSLNSVKAVDIEMVPVSNPLKVVDTEMEMP